MRKRAILAFLACSVLEGAVGAGCSSSEAMVGSGTGGGSSTGGGAAATSGAGGREGSGGAGASHASPSACKRGIATRVAPAALSPSIHWWYDWGTTVSGDGGALEFVPMIWGSSTTTTALPEGTSYVLGFNEPNFYSQAKLSPQQAADLWPDVEASARARGAALVSPAVNFCGPASQCYGTDPYQYLKDFFAACATCQVDYVAVHWYNCDLDSLRDYLEPGGSLEGFAQFGRPLWLTEFACAENGDSSAVGQEAYMREAIPYLEGSPQVFRYAWFSASDIPGAQLLNPDGGLSALGRVYAELPQSCP